MLDLRPCPVGGCWIGCLEVPCDRHGSIQARTAESRHVLGPPTLEQDVDESAGERVVGTPCEDVHLALTFVDGTKIFPLTHFSQSRLQPQFVHQSHDVGWGLLESWY